MKTSCKPKQLKSCNPIRHNRRLVRRNPLLVSILWISFPGTSFLFLFLSFFFLFLKLHNYKVASIFKTTDSRWVYVFAWKFFFTKSEYWRLQIYSWNSPTASYLIIYLHFSVDDNGFDLDGVDRILYLQLMLRTKRTASVKIISMCCCNSPMTIFAIYYVVRI